MKIGYVNPSVINDSIMTEKLRNRFCKDTGINIKFCGDRDLFMDRLMLCSEDIHDEYVNFVEEVKILGGEQAFFEYYANAKENAINTIKNSPAYKEFISCDINKQYPLLQLNFPKNGIYKETNNGRTFISIDLAKGNYTATRYFDKSIVCDTDEYRQFIGKFTDSKHIMNSKYIRQVIFGNCNPKRQTHVERYIMQQIYNKLSPIISDNNIAAFMDDEIVYDITDIGNHLSLTDSIQQAVTDIEKELDIKTHFKTFTLDKLKDVYFLKDDAGKIFETKCVNYITFPFVQRFIRNEEPKESDYIFEFEGMRAKLLENPLEYEFLKNNISLENEDEREM